MLARGRPQAFKYTRRRQLLGNARERSAEGAFTVGWQCSL